MSLENFDNFIFKNGPIENFVYVELMNLFSGYKLLSTLVAQRTACLLWVNLTRSILETLLKRVLILLLEKFSLEICMINVKSKIEQKSCQKHLLSLKNIINVERKIITRDKPKTIIRKIK